MPWSGNEDELRAAYTRHLPTYRRAAEAFATAVTESLRTISLDAIAVSYRVKGYDSFRRKLEVKEYRNPFMDSPDVIGVRVIVLHNQEVKRAVEVISIDFEVLSSEAKGEQSESGYRSHHLDLRIPEKWTLVPTFRGMHELRFELQVRTALMHAWAVIEHCIY